ncbi:MAG: alpha-glucan family phosphorylase [Chloroflexi bacterium]|nr:alpha-glucan family phosphorylase [Chloroflexota bacterium]
MISKIPERIGRLDELANNLWWSWHHDARNLFATLDYPLWRASSQNPVKQLREMTPDKLLSASRDRTILALYDSAIAAFDADVSVRDCWFAEKYAGRFSGPVAFFSAEFALHKSLPIYAGGLGVLAGDICKEACDLGLPLIGIGFMYPQGYFRQRISADGWQEEIYEYLNFEEAPISPCAWPEGCGPLVEVRLAGRLVHIAVWEVRLGRVRLYLLDTNVEENAPGDRQLSARLYTADREHRMQQEIVLGIGGVRVLRALGMEPCVWHANEGHTAFMMLERLREEVAAGSSFEEGMARTQASSVFTTHTPVPAGHDIFPVELIDRYFNDYWGLLGTDRRTFLQLGQADVSGASFNMTALGLRLARQRCGVSALHGRVTRRMWHSLWPGVKEEKVPISHVTNGVHVPTWIAPELYQLCEKHLGANLMRECDDEHIWDSIVDIPDAAIWAVRRSLKRRLIRVILDKAQQRWVDRSVTGEQIVAFGALLDPDKLTIGFARRFAEYKRPALIFRDLERLKKIVGDRWRPVQIIFAGKSHPADFPSKHLLQQAFNMARNRDFLGRIAFVEDYDMLLSRYLVQGVDVWLNVPRRLQEACGTSGMKASLNGVPHFSVRDGWWHEGYHGRHGWAIGEETVDLAKEDETDAAALYQCLEEKIVPLYYRRDRSGVPQEWIQVVKNAIRSAATAFSARRMLKEYTERLYLPAAELRKTHQP